MTLFFQNRSTTKKKTKKKTGVEHLPVEVPKFQAGAAGAAGQAPAAQPPSRGTMAVPISLAALNQNWLVVNGCHQFGIFPKKNWVAVIIPTDELIFFRGVAKNHQPEKLCQFLWSILASILAVSPG